MEKIQDLTKQSRKILLHAANKWHGTIHTCLWPYAIHTTNDVFNTIANNNKKLSPMERFSGSKVAPQLKKHHTFGCPIYSLDPLLQDEKHIPRWKTRARLGIYLSVSPRHARLISLVIKPNT